MDGFHSLLTIWSLSTNTRRGIRHRAVHQSLVETKYRSKRRGAPRFETIVVRARPFDDIVPQNQLQGKAVVWRVGLMISGVVLQWYMEYSKKNDVDDNRSGDLCHMLSTVGVLRPTTTQQPRFSSAMIPVHTLLTAEAAVLAVIRSGMSVALVPPKHFINSTPTDHEYREYYNSHIAVMTSSSRQQALTSPTSPHHLVCSPLHYNQL